MKKLVEPQGRRERFLTKKRRNLVEIIIWHGQDTIRVFLRMIKNAAGHVLPPPLTSLVVAEHADGVWLAMPIPRAMRTEAAALAEARLFAHQHFDVGQAA